MARDRRVKRNDSLDPFEWAILGVVITGGGLLITLKQKIKDRKKEKSEKARNGNRLRLQEMKECLKELQGLVEGFHALVELRIDTSERGITRGSWEFRSEEAMERFNRSFDRMTYLISRLNRCVNEIDLQGITLTEKDAREFVAGPIQRVTESVEKAIAPSTEPVARLDLVKSILHNAEQLVANLGEALR